MEKYCVVRLKPTLAVKYLSEEVIVFVYGRGNCTREDNHSLFLVRKRRRKGGRGDESESCRRWLLDSRGGNERLTQVS